NRSVRAIHGLRVLHKDLMPRNILWNEETGQVMVIDFERAGVAEPRTILGVVPTNRKRKRGLEGGLAKQRGDLLRLQGRCNGRSLNYAA
ncbi:uncharacterized protein K441DRAFT_569670, partial [Cenococcum geophilum 1.58]|uniref:uncharacterized protein n=1 Tax=Cenococcum geophilum 1.58 TaxID=794803 RepID=UPI00358ED2F2